MSVTDSLEEVLKEINGKLDKIDEKFEVKLDDLQKYVSNFSSLFSK